MFQSCLLPAAICYLICYVDTCTGKIFDTAEPKINDFYPEKSVIQIFDTEQAERSKYERSAENFKCQSSGKFPNTESRSSYWFCDVSPGGGFLAIRRSCPLGQVFNPKYRQCKYNSDKRCGDANAPPESKVSYIVLVTEESTTEIPEILLDDACWTTKCTKHTTCGTTTPSCPTTTPSCPTTTTTCSTPTILFKCKSEGAFPNPDDCNSFFICHLKRDSRSVYEKLKVRCPEGMAFDDKVGWCSEAAKAICDESKFLNAKDVKSELPARVIRKSSSSHRNQKKKTRFKVHKGYINDKSNFLKTKRSVRSKVVPRSLERIIVDQRSAKSFRCSCKGRFPDPDCTNKYYICYPKETDVGFLTLKMKCPRDTVFDAKSLRCTRPNRENMQ